LLEIDSYKILVNCGSSTDLDATWCDENKEILSQVDCVILSHGELKYIEAIPSLRRIEFYGTIYSTIPVKQLGRIAVQEQNMNLRRFYNREVYEDSEIESSFSDIVSLKYLQPVLITPKISLTAYRSGHSLGGCVWKITKDIEDIVISIGVNHRREVHIDGIDLSCFSKTSLCILDSNYVLKEHYVRMERDNQLTKAIGDAILNKKKDSDTSSIFTIPRNCTFN
jgi:Cft2 family RNA processing exonuclease